MPALTDGSRRPGPGDWRAVGWLAPSTAFPTGPVGEPYRHRLFTERLFEACRSWVVDVTPRCHPCPFCPPGEDDRIVLAERHGRRAPLGTGEVHVIDRARTAWAAPTLVYHYVTEHGYRPPEGFVEGLLAGTVQRPDPAPTGALRIGEPVGVLARLDPELDTGVRDELIAGGLDPESVPVELPVCEAERFEAPGVWRPVLAWAIGGDSGSGGPGGPGGPGGQFVAFDGTDSWRADVRAAAGVDR